MNTSKALSFLVVTPILLLPVPATALDIYMVRHAETVANVLNDYSHENQHTFSDRGLEQIDSLTKKLEAYSFDHILVSPAWRTQQTILPFLRQRGMQAEIWPELEEAGCELTGEELAADVVRVGDPIQRIDEQVFVWRDNDSKKHLRPANASETVAQLQRARDRILERFGDTDKSILFVSHGCSGSRIAELLLDVRPQGRLRVRNASLFHIRYNDADSRELLLVNGEPASMLDRLGFVDRPGPVAPDLLSLAGMWRIRSGDDPAWSGHDVDDGAWKSTRVPGVWEKDALPDYDGMAWYRHSFSMDESTREGWESRAAALVIGAVDDADETFLNGVRIGATGEIHARESDAYQTPRVYPIPPGLLKDENIIAVRVQDVGGGGGIWRGPVGIMPRAVAEQAIQE